MPLAESSAPASPAPLSSALYGGIVLLTLLVLAAGLAFPDLMVADAPQDAVMAMRMHYENDWVNLIRNGYPYLDKPHLLFWSANAAYKLFGVHDWSYRLFSVLATLLGAFSTFKLGQRLYDDTVGKMAAVIFLTAYATVLGNHDVRMDALLTAFTVFGLWQLVVYVDTGRSLPLVLGAAGIALAVSAKGMVAVAFAGPCLLLYLWGRRQWRRLWSPRVALGVAAFLLAFMPVLVCYYLQYDLHPEQDIWGQTNVSGVKFILLGQSFERFGGGRGQASANDRLFLFHTMLWAFLPWSLLAVAAWFQRFRDLVRGGWAAFHGHEQLTWLGVILFMAVLGFSRFKLPHYLNICIPLLAIATAAFLAHAYANARPASLRVLSTVQAIVIAAAVAVGAVLSGWAFPVRSAWVAVCALALAALLVLGFRLRDGLQRVWATSALAAVLVNFTLNANFFPQLARYQPGSEFAARALALDIDWSRTFFLDRYFYPFQIYTRHLVPRLDLAQVQGRLAAGQRVFLLVAEEGMKQVREAGLAHRALLQSPDCRVTNLSVKLLDPRTREGACPQAYLLELR